MNLYKLGLSGGEIALPQHPALTHAANIYHGTRGIAQAGGRFYRSGVAGNVVGAQTGGPFGSLFDKLTNLLLDIAHVLLILGGIYLLAKGLAGGLGAF